MKETIKEVLLMGLGAMSLTGEKAKELKKELLEKGEEAYKEGTIKNEELKRDFKEKIKEEIKENTNITYTKMTKEDLKDLVKEMTPEEKAEFLDMLNEKED